MTRRDFIKSSATAAAVAGASAHLLANATASTVRALPEPSATQLPRWRGFNLLEKFIATRENSAFREADFEWIAEFGFNFARLPMSYRCWSTPENWKVSDERVLAEIDQAVEFGRKHGVHVNLNFHRAPGYSVDMSLAEPFNLWTDAEALEACCHHWAMFARRYKGIPNTQLTFDLVNEPAFLKAQPFTFLDDASYARVARALVAAIRAEDPSRLVISDGLLWGQLPVAELADLGVGQSTRGYAPHEVTHWKAEWVDGSDKWPEPKWPFTPTEEQAQQFLGMLKGLQQAMPQNLLAKHELTIEEARLPWDRARLKRNLVLWKQLEAMGVGIHVGECGVYNKTPHAVALGFLEDNLANWQEVGWGWALWNFRGDFGVLDSGRSDVAYEAFRGHKLDRKMLELLQRY